MVAQNWVRLMGELEAHARRHPEANQLMNQFNDAVASSPSSFSFQEALQILDKILQIVIPMLGQTPANPTSP